MEMCSLGRITHFDTQNNVVVYCSILQSRSTFRPNCLADAHLAVVFKIKNLFPSFFILEVVHGRPSMHATRLIT